MKYRLSMTDDSMSEGIVKFLMHIGREMNTSFRFDFHVQEEDCEGCRRCLEVEEEFWGNSLEFLVDFLECIESIIEVEKGDYKRVKIIPKEKNIPFLDFKKMFMLAVGPLWTRMGMCRLIEDGNVRYEIIDLAGPTYFRALTGLVNRIDVKKEAKTETETEIRLQKKIVKTAAQLSAKSKRLPAVGVPINIGAVSQEA